VTQQAMPHALQLAQKNFHFSCFKISSSLNDDLL